MQNYFEELEKFKKSLKEFSTDTIDELKLENFFEMLEDRSCIHDYDSVLNWLKNLRSNPKIKIEEIPLNSMNEWSINPSGKITHSSKDFFEVVGVRTTTNDREVTNGWDQPLLRQVGFDGGLLGIIRSRIDNVPHYLLEAKFEPGNYGFVQLSPTLQATFANINKKHGGRKPYFTELFVNRENDPKVEVLFEAWLSEDGGRLDRKRNKGILINVDYDEIKLPNDNFKWLSLYQIKKLIHEDAFVSPHVRGILSFS